MCQLLQVGDWAIWLDLRDAYFRVPIYHHHRQFVKFRWNSERLSVQMSALFLSTSPHTFTRVTKPVVQSLGTMGIQTVFYLDDVLVLADSESGATDGALRTVSLLQNVGFSLNWVKSNLAPAVFNGLKAFQKKLINKMVTVQIGNTTVVAYLSKEGGQNRIVSRF